MKLKQEYKKSAIKYFYYIIVLFLVTSPICISQNNQNFQAYSNNAVATSFQNYNSI